MACDQVSRGTSTVIVDPLGSCESVFTCNWTGSKACIDYCFGQDLGCTTGGLGDADAATLIALMLIAGAAGELVFALIAIFVQSCRDKHGSRVKWIVLTSAICGLSAIIIFAAGGSDCLQDGVSIGASIIVDIVAVLVCFVAVFCLHFGFGAEPPSTSYSAM